MKAVAPYEVISGASAKVLVCSDTQLGPMLARGGLRWLVAPGGSSRAHAPHDEVHLQHTNVHVSRGERGGYNYCEEGKEGSPFKFDLFALSRGQAKLMVRSLNFE